MKAGHHELLVAEIDCRAEVLRRVVLIDQEQVQKHILSLLVVKQVKQDRLVVAGQPCMRGQDEQVVLRA